PIETFRFDPEARTHSCVAGVLSTPSLHDPNAILDAAKAIDSSLDNDAFRSKLAECIEKAERAVRVPIQLPTAGARMGDDSLLDQTCRSLREKVSEYRLALGSSPADSAPTDVLRIAYSFAEETEKMVSLIWAICDLRPLLLWLTID